MRSVWNNLHIELLLINTFTFRQQYLCANTLHNEIKTDIIRVDTHLHRAFLVFQFQNKTEVCFCCLFNSDSVEYL